MRASFLRAAIASALVALGLAKAVYANDHLSGEPENDPTNETALPFVIETPPITLSVEGPLKVAAPPLVLAVEGPLEIDAPPLVLAVEGPLEINAPDLVLAVEGPLDIDAPALVITAFEPFVVTAPVLPIIIEEDQDTARESEIADASTTPKAPTDSAVSTDPVAPSLCVGTYRMYMKQSVGSSPGHVMPVGAKEVARATVSTESCGAFLTLAAQGQEIQLARQHEDTNRYEGELRLPDGAKRKLSLTCGANLTLFGGIAARDDRVQINRQIWMQLDRVSEATLTACAEPK